MSATPTTVEPIAVTVAQAAQLIGVGRTKAYSMIKAGEIPVVRVGTITRVPLAALRERFSPALDSQSTD